MEAYADRLDVDKIREAYEVAVEAHAGQRRASGEEYVSHTVEVATILATLRLDSASIISGLIHDTVEDTALSLSDVEARFGKEVATIVDGVTKPSPTCTARCTPRSSDPAGRPLGRAVVPTSYGS